MCDYVCALRPLDARLPVLITVACSDAYKCSFLSPFSLSPTALFTTLNTEGQREKGNGGCGGVDVGVETTMEEETVKITCRDWKGGGGVAGRQKEEERGRGYRGGCYIQDDEN